MPLAHEIRPRPPPRYLGNLNRLLALMVLCVLLNVFFLVRDVQREKDVEYSPIRVFEVLTMANGRVVVCSSTNDGITTTQPIYVGTFYQCSPSNMFVKRIRRGRKGCLSFADKISAENFLECVAGADHVVQAVETRSPTAIATAD